MNTVFALMIVTAIAVAISVYLQFMFLVFSLGCDMNTVFALMIVTAMGVTEAPNNFTTMQACQSASAKIKTDSYCVEKKPVNVEKEKKWLQ